MTTKKNKDPVENLVEEIGSLTLVQLASLVEALREKFGIKEAMFAPQVAAAPTQAAPEAKKEEEKTEFTVKLVSIGDKKIQVLKELRSLIQLGLKEAKELIDSVPSVVKEKVSKEEAMEMKTRLEAVGAKVEVS